MEQAVAFFSLCHSSEREVETQSFARVREHSARLHALVHTPQDFLSHSNDRHVDRIHMHFHENQTDTQHHSVGSTTPLRNPSDTGLVRLAIRPNYLPPQLSIVALTCFFGHVTCSLWVRVFPIWVCCVCSQCDLVGAVPRSQAPWWIFFKARFLASVATVSLNVLLRRRGLVALPSGFVISVTSTSVGSLFWFFHHVMFQA